MADVPLDPAFAAFGVPATVTPPGGAAIETTGIWVSPLTEDAGFDLKRREARKVFVLRRDEVPSVPNRTAVEAPERLGGPVRSWLVDGFERIDADEVRAVLVLNEA